MSITDNRKRIHAVRGTVSGALRKVFSVSPANIGVLAARGFYVPGDAVSQTISGARRPDCHQAKGRDSDWSDDAMTLCGE